MRGMKWSIAHKKQSPANIYLVGKRAVLGTFEWIFTTWLGIKLLPVNVLSILYVRVVASCIVWARSVDTNNNQIELRRTKN